MERSGELGLTVRVLGPTVIEAGARVVRVNRPLERALVVRLALARGAGVAYRTLIRDLWADDEFDRPMERLRVLVYRLRQTLGDHGDAIGRTAGGYALNASPVDLIAVEELAAQLAAARRAGTRSAGDELAEALRRWRQPALEDLRDFPFAASQGARLDALRLSLRIESIELELAAGSRDTAELEQLVAENPLHERLVGLSAVALYRGGRQAEALQRLARLRKQLAEELGIDPAPQTTELELHLLRHDPALTATADRSGVAAGLWPRGTGVGSSAFVGRDSELATLLEALAPSTLITLTGGPGVGKTRLAREVAAAVGRPAARTGSGNVIVWLDLAAVQTSEAVLPALTAAMGVESGPGDPMPRIVEKLTGALLVVDNAEHLVDELAGLLPRIRSGAADLVVMVTSQRPLRISGEQVHQVDPLSRAAAISLFRSRSGVGPDEQIEVICSAVDRLPLAIELAAGLTRTLTVDQLATRIGHRLRLLVGGNRDSGIRHGSLRTALGWSYSLLDPLAQAVLRRLAVFVGGCTLEAAEQVVSGDSIDLADVGPILYDLNDRGLLAVETGGDGARYRLLETIRDFALEALSAENEEIAVRRRHTVWCVELANRTSTYGGSFTRELSQEEANLRAAAHWSLGEDGDPSRVLSIAVATWYYWWSRGLIGLPRDWLRRVLGVTESERTPERAAALAALATITRHSGDAAEGQALGKQAHQLYRELGDEAGQATTLIGLCFGSVSLHDFETALEQGRLAIEGATRLGDPRTLFRALTLTGVALRCLGRRDEAEQLFTRSLELCVESNDRLHLADNLAHLALIAQQNEAFDRSRELCLRALRLYRDLDLLEGQVDVLELLAGVEAEAGRPAAALQLLVIATSHRAGLGVPLTIPDEITARDRAEAKARRVLGPAAEAATAAARGKPLEPLVDALLAGPVLAGDHGD